MVNSLDPTVEFYTKQLGFSVQQERRPNFAMLSRGDLELALSTPFGPGGAAKPMSDGRKAEPPGTGSSSTSITFRAKLCGCAKHNFTSANDIVSGPGGSEILLDDPSGNPVELFQPADGQSHVLPHARAREGNDYCAEF